MPRKDTSCHACILQKKERTRTERHKRQEVGTKRGREWILLILKHGVILQSVPETSQAWLDVQTWPSLLSQTIILKQLRAILETIISNCVSHLCQHLYVHLDYLLNHSHRFESLYVLLVMVYSWVYFCKFFSMSLFVCFSHWWWDVNNLLLN